MAGKLAQILSAKADLHEGTIIITQIPATIIQSTKITVSPTPPSNPQIGELWIQIITS